MTFRQPLLGTYTWLDKRAANTRSHRLGIRLGIMNIGPKVDCHHFVVYLSELDVK